MDSPNQLQKLCLIEMKQFLFLVVVVAVTHVVLQSVMLPYGTALLSLLASETVPLNGKDSLLSSQLSTKSSIPRNSSIVNASDSVDSQGFLGSDGDFSPGEGSLLNGEITVPGDDSVHNETASDEVSIETENTALGNVNISVAEENKTREKSSKPIHGMKVDNRPRLDRLSANKSVRGTVSNGYIGREQRNGVFSRESNLPVKDSNSALSGVRLKKKTRNEMPPKSVTPIDKMNQMLARHYASSIKSMKPLWSSPREKEIIDSKLKIIDAPSSKNDGELYPPIFRNVSRFLRSYELMERVLKVYVYKDGQKPIFHQPVLKGLYASEGWFMKLMEGNKHFVVKDPQQAHLFYMPFSSRMLEYTLYVRNSHNRTNLRQYVKEYSETLAAKYPFWNRSGGMDHFLVACHDWAPYETRHHLEFSIKALCNADETVGFKIGRDVSLPETYVRNARNPLRNLGGKPPSEREILAFYAGNNHGYLRPILLKHWKDKDPDMKIYRLMPKSVTNRMNYFQHMKSSKYCLCPKGFEVNSPRVMEAIFYDCVPVIISDNFVPPLFEILNWEAFSVIVAEKDVPNLKDILLSIPEEKYLALHHAVKMVQRHFLWHARPVKYDLFYMTLHSIWYNRVFQIRPKTAP